MDLQQQPPQVEIVYNEDKTLADGTSFNNMSARFLKQMEENIASYETAKKEREEFGQFIQSIIKNQADIKEHFENFKETKQKSHEIYHELKKITECLQTDLKTHKTKTLENINAMLGHTEKIQVHLAEQTAQIETINQQMQTMQKRLEQESATPRVREVVESEQERNSKLEQDLRKWTEKFNNFIQNRTSLDNEQKQKQEALDARLTQDQEAKDATLQQLLKQLEPLNTAIANQDEKSQTLWRRVQLWMTGSTAVLLASIWFWWQAHKA